MNSIENIKRKLTLLNDVQMSHEQDDIHIQKAQEYLDVKLPNSFKEYLKEFGNLSFTGYEFYGLTKNNDFKNSSIPNFVWATKEHLNKKILEEKLVLFYSHNDEWLYCLDTKSMKDEICDIVIWDKYENTEAERFHIDFLVFLEEFIDEIMEEI